MMHSFIENLPVNFNNQIMRDIEAVILHGISSGGEVAGLILFNTTLDLYDIYQVFLKLRGSLVS